MSISVVIPAYNASRFLAQTLRNVLAQTQPPEEVLVIDDGSTDDTAAIAESFGPPVRVFRRPNSRQAASRNFGVQQATSEWIAFIDADDLWTPDKLQRQTEVLAAHPEADVCYTDHIKFRQECEEDPMEMPVDGPGLKYYPAAQVRRGLLESVTFLPSSVLIRRSTFLRFGGFGTTFRIVEDWDLWLRLLHAGVQFVSCDAPLLLYRMHSNNVTKNAITLHQENMLVYRTRVKPLLRGPSRWFAPAIYFSQHNVDLAYLLREAGDPTALSVMTSSILQWPFGDLTRYKVWLHMMLHRGAQESVNSS